MSTFCEVNAASAAVGRSQIVYSELMDRPIDRLLARAAEMNMRESQLAKMLSVSHARLSNWKKRGLPADMLVPAAGVVGMTVEQLMGMAPSDAPQPSPGPVAASAPTTQRKPKLMERAVAEALYTVSESMANVPDEKRFDAVELCKTFAMAPDSPSINMQLGALLSQCAPPHVLYTWRDAAVELITELSVHGKTLDPASLVSAIDAVHSDRIAQARAKSAQPKKAEA